MELHLNDILELKKDHPCGSRLAGAAGGNGYQAALSGLRAWVMQPRRKVEKMIKRIVPKEE